jgi:hypothetical protein
MSIAISGRMVTTATVLNARVCSPLKPSLLGRVVSRSLIAPSDGFQTIDLRARLDIISPDVINKVQLTTKYQNQTVTAEDYSNPYKTTEAAQLEIESSESLEAYTYGAWEPPICMNQWSNISCHEKDIDQFYNNHIECCYSCP